MIDVLIIYGIEGLVFLLEYVATRLSYDVSRRRAKIKIEVSKD